LPASPVLIFANPDTASTVAEDYARRGDLGAALEILREIVERFPDRIASYLDLSRLLVRMDRHDEAAAIADAARVRFPGYPAPYLEEARIAEERRDWNAAVECWRLMRTALPGSVSGWIGGAAALRELQQFDAADELLLDACQRFPHDQGPMIERAWLATHRGDWCEAIRRWAQVREELPDHLAGWTAAAAALQGSGANHEADALLADAVRKFPDDPVPLTELARLAQRLRDWPKAAERWAHLRAKFPDLEAGWTGGAAALEQAGDASGAASLLSDAAQRFPTLTAPLLEFARRAHDRRDWPEAAYRWDLLRRFRPTELAGYHRGTIALFEQERFDEAESIVLAGIGKFPDSAELRIEQAWMDFRQSRWETADARFASLRVDFPQVDAGYIGGAQILRLRNRMQDAEDLLEAGIRLSPDSPILRLELAHLIAARDATMGLGLARAIASLTNARAKFPDYEPIYLLTLRLLREAGREEEAKSLTIEAARRWPLNMDLAREYADLATTPDELASRIDWFQSVLQRSSDQPAGYVGLATSLSKLHRHDEADTILIEATRKFPDDNRVFAEFAQAAEYRDDWPAAVQRWTDAQMRFPREQRIVRSGYVAKLRLAEIGVAGTATADAPVPVSRSSSHDLLLQFESLGGSQGACEFGLLQRDFDAEPLGLLRWASLSPEQLALALEQDFEGVGHPDHTVLDLARQGTREEYITTDRRFGMLMHTFVYRDQVPYEKMFTLICRRLQSFRWKLLEDLKAGVKIFIYKAPDLDMASDQLERIHQAIQRHGPGALLHIRSAGADHPDGSLEVVSQGLMIGYIVQLMGNQAGDVAPPATASWLSVCRAAHDNWNARP
jgi:predicted Zn-dependent protease